MCYVIKKLSKKGTEYLCLVINGVYVSFDMVLIDKVLRSQGSNLLEAARLDIEEKIFIKEVEPD